MTRAPLPKPKIDIESILTTIMNRIASIEESMESKQSSPVVSGASQGVQPFNQTIPYGMQQVPLQVPSSPQAYFNQPFSPQWAQSIPVSFQVGFWVLVVLVFILVMMGLVYFATRQSVVYSSR